MQRAADEEYVQYVRARQHRLLRAAWLVCEDTQVAEDLVLATFARLALRWEKLRGEGPDAFVRRILYREAVSAWRTTRRESIQVDRSGSLAALTAAQRAVLVVRFFENRSAVETAEALGGSAGSVTTQTRTALATLRPEAAMTEGDLVALLERASGHLPELDFAVDAWSAALAGQRHRRRVWRGWLAALAAAVGLAVVAVQVGGSTHPRPTPAPSRSPATTGLPRLADGTAYAQLPLEGDETELRHFDAGIPSVLEIQAAATTLSALKKPLPSVVAVYLAPAGGGTSHPVLVSGSGQRVVADRLTLVPTRDAAGNAGPALGPRAVGGGGRYVVFAQPGRVVRLDTRTGAVVTYPLPSQTLQSVGWTAAGSLVVARDAESAWTVDPWMPGARAVAAGRGYEGRFRLSAAADSVAVERFDGQARPGALSTVKAPVVQTWGETLNTEEWAAAGAVFDQDLTHSVIRQGNGPIYQGLVAVDVSAGSARVLLAPESPDGQTGRFKECCTALGWADGHTLLFQAVGRHGRWVLAWNVTTGEVFEVAQLVTAAPDDPVTPLALDVGWRY